MTMNDPIADMLARIKNAQQAQKQDVQMPASKQKKAILDVLQKEGYVESYAEGQDEDGHPQLTVGLKYMHGKPVIQRLNRVSRPGLRHYTASSDIPMVANGLGVTIVSTSQGVMSDTQARRLKIGGEVLCQVF